jgi:hypothetical protein
VWTLDEQTLTAKLVVNADLGSYSGALGAAERLSNGNYSFTLGVNGPEPPVPPARTVEVSPDGQKVFELQVNKPEYRAYRMRTLYEGVDDALAGPPQRVASVVINDGSAQRSMVKSVTVTFGGLAFLGPGAIELRGHDGTPISFQSAVSAWGGDTVALLTFAGPQFVGASLADGNYTLTILALRVHDRFGRALDGDADGTAGGDRVDAFFRLYGDSDGDRDVDWNDLKQFLGTIGRKNGNSHYLWYFDANGDDFIGLIDLVAFAGHAGRHLAP